MGKGLFMSTSGPGVKEVVIATLEDMHSAFRTIQGYKMERKNLTDRGNKDLFMD